MSGERKIGEVILAVEDVSLAFGGVKALSGVSFDVREHEVRAIIGPNGAGKSSMLNVINGVYHPQQGTIRLRIDGQLREFHDMDPHEVALSGIARTFQNLALFKGMSVLDNIMTGRNLRMRTNLLLQALRLGPAARRDGSPRSGRADHRFSRDPGMAQNPCGTPALRTAEARRPR